MAVLCLQWQLHEFFDDKRLFVGQPMCMSPDFNQSLAAKSCESNNVRSSDGVQRTIVKGKTFFLQTESTSSQISPNNVQKELH